MSSPIRTLPKAASLALALAVVLGMLRGAWEGSLYNSDDYIYMDHVRTILETGDWMELRFQGAILHQRPPLSVWLMTVSQGVLGTSVFAARLPQILMGLVSLLFTFLIGRDLFRDERLAWFGVGLMMSTHAFFFHTRGVTSDAALLAGLTGFFFFHLRFERGWGYAVGLGVAMAWMAMTKSVVAVLPIGAAILHWTVQGRWRILISKRFMVAAGVALFLVAPWHIVMTLRHGTDFWREYIGFNVLDRAGNALFFEPDPLYYVRRLLRFEGILPYLYLLGFGAGLWRLVRTRDPSDRFLFLWLFCLLLPFQLSSTRLYHYLIPSVPALSLLTARIVAPILVRPWGFPVILLVIFGLFIDNNGANLRPEYAGDQRRFSETLEGVVSDPEVRVFSYNRYELAFFHFMDRPVRMVTDQEEVRDTLGPLPVFERSGAVEFLEPGALEEFLVAGSFICITEPAWVPQICAAARGRCETGAVVLLEGVRAVVLTDALPPGEVP